MKNTGLKLIFVALLLPLLFTACDFGGSSDNSGNNITIEPSQEFLEKKLTYLQYCYDNGAPGQGGIGQQVCRAYLSADTYNEDAIRDKLFDKIDLRKDCSDFDLNKVLRILMFDRNKPCLPDALRADMKNTVLNFKYWLDEPGPDDMVWWSENHQILFHTAEMLAGLLYPDEIFTNSGMTGAEHVEHARPLLHRWLDFRGTFGFSEWHSNVYFNEDMPPLVNLVDFADEESIRIKAAMCLDMLTFDMLTNYHNNRFATTHGRTYPDKLTNGLGDSTHTAAPAHKRKVLCNIQN